MNSKTITVICGDKREIYLVESLLNLKTRLILIGFENQAGLVNLIKNHANIELSEDLDASLISSDVVILPMPGIDNNGVIRSTCFKYSLVFNEDIARLMKPNVLVLVGFASPYLKYMADKYGFNLVETADTDHLAILNAIPSAEGAIAKAMELTPITIHGSNSLVIGFGRVGTTLARMLKGLGANTHVAARKNEQLARAFEMSCKPIKLENLDTILDKMDIVFNTVPAMVLDASKLKVLNKRSVIIDLATAPGGVDYYAAKELNIIAYLAPGLPGIVAPQTAGKILGEVYPQIILKHFGITGRV
ncbi:MAG: dipicolinate synthase subunit DpsA [Bacillota bacterium]